MLKSWRSTSCRSAAAQRRQRAGGLCFGKRYGGGPGCGFSRAENLQGPAAPAAACGDAARRRVVRRFQGHQRRRDRRRAARPRPQERADPRRRRQGAGFFAAEAMPFRAHASKVLLIGRDAPLDRESRAEANTAVRLRKPSSGLPGLRNRVKRCCSRPACASFDMFRDYRHRGEVFAQAVRPARAMSQTYVFARNAPNAEYDRSRDLGGAAARRDRTGHGVLGVDRDRGSEPLHRPQRGVVPRAPRRVPRARALGGNHRVPDPGAALAEGRAVALPCRRRGCSRWC